MKSLIVWERLSYPNSNKRQGSAKKQYKYMPNQEM